MIIWGGWNSPFFNTGGRYNPTTDSWTATSTTNAPLLPDRAHTAVWTGIEMIVWGGFDNMPPLYEYRRADTILSRIVGQPPALAMRPLPEALHTAVWTGSEMIIWGGYDGHAFCVTPAADTIPAQTVGQPPAPPMRPLRESHTAVWTGSEMIVWGGFDCSGDLNTGGRYNPGTDSWTATSTTNAPAAR